MQVAIDDKNNGMLINFYIKENENSCAENRASN